MKKAYLFLAALAIAGAAQAQRNIDWQVEDILTPNALNSTLQGTPLAVTAQMKNNGTDNALTGDTIFYQIVIRSAADAVILTAPQSGLFFSVLPRDVNNGDTMHLVAPNLNINVYLNNSADVKLQVFALVGNRGTSNPITPETQTTLMNNLFSKNIVWFNPQGWNVSVEETSGVQLLNAGPNPAANELHVNWLVNTTDASGTSLKVYDLSGRLVLEHNAHAFESSQTLDVSGLNNGLYLLEVSNAAMHQVLRIQVQH